MRIWGFCSVALIAILISSAFGALIFTYVHVQSNETNSNHTMKPKLNQEYQYIDNHYDNLDNNVVTNDQVIYKTRSMSRAWGVDKKLGGIDSSNITLTQLYPTVASDYNRSIFCAWQDIRTADWDIYFTRSTNFGLDWEPNKLVTNPNTSSGHQQYPKMVLGPTSEPNLYLVWQDARTDDGDIYFSYSTDYGDTWQNEIQINTNSLQNTIQGYPDIVCDAKGRLYVVWSDLIKDGSETQWDIKFSKSVNNGMTWSTPIRVNDPISVAGRTNQSRSEVAVDSNGRIYVVWEDDRDDEMQIYFSKSTDSGKSFSSDVQISSVRFGAEAQNPNIKVDGTDNVLVVYQEDYLSKYNVYFTISMDLGNSFTKAVRVNDESDKCSADAKPDVEVDEKGNIFVTWADQRAKNHIYLGYSLDSGNSFVINEQVDDADNTTATPISTTTEEELERFQQVLCLLKDKVFIFWTDYINDPIPDDGQEDNGDIYFDWNITPANRKPNKINFDKDKTIKGWNYLNLSWPRSEDLDFNKYLIYKSTLKDFTPDEIFLNSTINNRLQNYVNITGLMPSTTYHFRLVVEDQGGMTNVSDQYSVSTIANIAPKLGFVEPDGVRDLADFSFDILWWDSDPDDNATIKLYYDTNQNPNDGMNLIAVVPYGEDSTKDFFTWDTSIITNGTYYISAIISDQVNGEQYPVYSQGKVTIFHGNLDPLLVLFMSPLNTTQVELNEPITVRFNKMIDNSTIHLDSFYVLDPFGNKVDGVFLHNKSSFKVKFYPQLRWNGSERYQVFLTRSIKDASGLFALAFEYSWWFETEEYIIPKGVIYGDITDSYTKDPISDVLVTLTDKINQSITYNITTDKSGKFTFQVIYGTYEISIEAESYQTPEIIGITLNHSSKDVKFELVRPVIVDFEIRYKIEVDEKLHVSAMAIHPNHESIEYFWDFGDGTIKPGQNLTHKYKKPGKFTVTVTVRDKNNGYVTQSAEIEVEEASSELDLIWLFSILIIILILVLLTWAVIRHRLTERKLKEAEERWAAEHEPEKERVLPEDEEVGEEAESPEEDESEPLKTKEEEELEELEEEAEEPVSVPEEEESAKEMEPIEEEELVDETGEIEEEVMPEEEVPELEAEPSIEEEGAKEQLEISEGKEKQIAKKEKRTKKIKKFKGAPVEKKGLRKDKKLKKSKSKLKKKKK